ncbi:hypothetical protein [Bradyrhizobium sp. AUGA SZCCT0283]|uniref:hypothetical protein n=1 Tax=Bradyrhizobium sp. AUGA SZCCT0283 TaxID=2807671 RepID=UPI001BAD5E23|nr:hypothetical protein [Bradyrhizobium sp. AUGA SZCCT0283]MBR1280152.1 hypothetical protein [Bradyrhizobium sp. AUGA SZCCT0283]
MRITRTSEGRFLLEAISGQTMSVNQVELTQLVTIAKSCANDIQRLASRGPIGLSTVQATRAVVSIDIYHTEVILRLFDGGSEQAYTLTHGLAKQVIVGLTNQVTRIEEEANTRRNVKKQ